MKSTKSGPAAWPPAWRAVAALLDATSLRGSVKTRFVQDSAVKTEGAEAKDYERVLAGTFERHDNESRLLVRIVDALLREIAGPGLGDVPEIVAGLMDLAVRYGALRSGVPAMWASQDALDWFVLSRLVVPWAAAMAAECAIRGVPLDPGMPDGKFWFLPSRGDKRIERPLNRVFDWWRDLVGCESRVDLAERLSQALKWTSLPDQINEWVSAKANLPTVAAIDRLAGAAETIGRAADCGALDAGETLAEQLINCVTFARGRNLGPDRLRLEIPPRRDEIKEIMAAVEENRTPVVRPGVAEAFVHHMRRRWAVPGRAEIRARLLVARSSQ